MGGGGEEVSSTLAMSSEFGGRDAGRRRWNFAASSSPELGSSISSFLDPAIFCGNRLGAKGEDEACCGGRRKSLVSKFFLLEGPKVNLGVEANCFAEEEATCGVSVCSWRTGEVGLGMEAGFVEGADARKRRGMGVCASCEQSGGSWQQRRKVQLVVAPWPAVYFAFTYCAIKTKWKCSSKCTSEIELISGPS